MSCLDPNGRDTRTYCPLRSGDRDGSEAPNARSVPVRYTRPVVAAPGARDRRAVDALLRRLPLTAELRRGQQEFRGGGNEDARGEHQGTATSMSDPDLPPIVPDPDLPERPVPDDPPEPVVPDEPSPLPPDPPDAPVNPRGVGRARALPSE